MGPSLVITFRKWLSGSFKCQKCGREFHILGFGFGDAICPDCYRGESQFLFYDTSFLLNRIVARTLDHRKRMYKPVQHAADEIIPPTQEDVVVTER